MAISAQLVKELREKTCAPMMQCKEALEKTDGNIEKAIEYLKEKGIALASKKADRVTKEGIVYSYIHPGNKIGVLIEVNCETDFVAKNDDFKIFVKDISMQIAAMNPKFIKREDVTEENKKKIVETLKQLTENIDKPEEELLTKYLAENILFEQPFIRDATINIENHIKTFIAKFGENITIKRYTRYQLGE
jgi:elongation factor Ts